MADENKPYIGYRSAGRRLERFNDRAASADIPVAAMRGAVSGVLGAPGDIESLIRMLPGLSERTVLPTSDDVERRLPLAGASASPAGRAFTNAGQLAGGFYTGPGSPLRAVAALPSAVSRAGRDFAMASGVPASNVVKNKGGNWLAGSIESSLDPMRRGGNDPAMMEVLRNADPRFVDQAALGRLDNQSNAVNRWLETKLAKYMRNEMATPEDPLRALAERGVMHYDPPASGYDVKGPRRAAGFPEEGLAQSDLGKRWEHRADTFVNGLRASDVSIDRYPDTVAANPWLQKVPPETPVYEMLRGADEDIGLGFGHLTDELRNAINPESGLPRELLWKYSDLDKVTVPQAVERVAKINEWRAANKAEADMARAMNKATEVVKEYPEDGFKWVQLRMPEDTGRKVSVEKSVMDIPPEADDAMIRNVAEDMAWDEGLEQGTREFNEFVERMTRNMNEKKLFEIPESRKLLEDALKYEGDTMGHCVGGYCDDVVSGSSKIYSLRDKKGQPHVTIEVKPPDGFAGMKTEEDFLRMARESQPEDVVQDMLKSAREHGAFTPSIIQIKGKGNRAPTDEYLPMVQDFVRSQQWGRIGDLQNTGLVQLPDKRLITKQQLDEGIQRLTGEGESPLNAEWFQRQISNDPAWWDNAKDAFEGFSHGGMVRGYASGGMVSASGGANFPTDDFDLDRISQIAAELQAINKV